MPSDEPGTGDRRGVGMSERLPAAMAGGSGRVRFVSFRPDERDSAVRNRGYFRPRRPAPFVALRFRIAAMSGRRGRCRAFFGGARRRCFRKVRTVSRAADRFHGGATAGFPPCSVAGEGRPGSVRGCACGFVAPLFVAGRFEPTGISPQTG